MTNELQVIEKQQDNRAEEKQEIDQIRKLLFGEFENIYSEKLKALEQKIEHFEYLTEERFQDLKNRLEQLSIDTKTSQKASMVELGETIVELGQQISNMGQDMERISTDGNESE